MTINVRPGGSEDVQALLALNRWVQELHDVAIKVWAQQFPAGLNATA